MGRSKQRKSRSKSKQRKSRNRSRNRSKQRNKKSFNTERDMPISKLKLMTFNKAKSFYKSGKIPTLYIKYQDSNKSLRLGKYKFNGKILSGPKQSVFKYSLDKFKYPYMNEKNRHHIYGVGGKVLDYDGKRKSTVWPLQICYRPRHALSNNCLSGSTIYYK
jgi:hypothetical protein